MKQQHDILIKNGEDFKLTFTWMDAEKQPISLAGKYVYAQLRENPDSPEYYDFICEHNGVGGEITIRLVHEQTSEISYTNGYYDVFVRDEETDTPILGGKAVIIPSVTKIPNGKFLLPIAYNSYADFPSLGNTNRIYIAADTNLMYRWDASGVYIPIMEWEGPRGEKGDKGDTGTGISLIEKIYSEGLVDTYRINFTDGTYTQYFVVNGKDGSDGEDGHDGVDGKDGQDGNGYFDYDEDTELITMVGEIPYQEVSNQSGGYTATIGF